MDVVKIAIFEKTRLSKGQLVTCIKKGSDLNLFMLDSDILYIIDESKEVWFGGSDDLKGDEEVNDTDDSSKGSDDSEDKSIEKEEANDTNDSFEGSDDFDEYPTSEDENPKKKTSIEPSVTAEEVTDSEFDKFMTALFEVFEANEKEQLPIEDVKRAIFEQTSITEGQFSTCIRKLIDLNEARYIGKVLYLI